VLAIVVVVLIGAAVGLFVSLGLGRRRYNEVERFHRAREMTTAWSRAGVTSPLLPTEREAPEAAEAVDHRA
jgi:hypothetical protein